MFNIYYINYAKAYEIAMLIDNKILESKMKEKDSSVDGHVGAGGDTYFLSYRSVHWKVYAQTRC